MRSIPLLFVLACFCLVGCAQKRTYDLWVTNQTDRPITLWLYKDGPPFEMEWLSPEELAYVNPSTVDVISGEVLAPNETKQAVQSGKFHSNVRAWLRVYRGEPSFNEMLATQRIGALRTDVPIPPGEQWVIVTDHRGRLVVTPRAEAPVQ